MSPAGAGRTRPTKPKKEARPQNRKREDVDTGKLEQAVAELDPKIAFSSFTDLPLSAPTTAGLKSAHFTTPTPIQQRTIPLALKGADILGAAQTGSGKTLAFLVPLLENLYRAQCVGADAGLGAMVVAPTRELAIQIFEVLRKIGSKGHVFAAGLVIGGKSLHEERDALARMNIVVCTPGRMLQHLSQTAGLSVDALRMLVLDEADRILDMGFSRDVDAIIEYLPREGRQTLLFSATQTKRVSDLARLSLREPEYVSVHEAAETATPKQLKQNYVVTPLPEKLDTLWSFLQSNKKAKTLAFFSSGKQVRFTFEAFRRMQPGVPLLHLHGRQKQTARLDITSRFAAAKTACLFSTDVAARGLDFPAVDWVVQVDCPEDADTYIHRVGRTARFERDGRAVLFLDPSEEAGMLSRLEKRKVPIERISVRAKKQQSIRDQLQNLCFKDPQLKYLGQKAFISYAKSVHLHRDKDVFRLAELDLDDFSASLGLPGAPRIKFTKGANDSKNAKNAPRGGVAVDPISSEEDESGAGTSTRDNRPKKKSTPQEAVRTKYDRMFERRNQDVLADHYAKLIHSDDSDADSDSSSAHDTIKSASLTQIAPSHTDGNGDDNFLRVKRRIPADGSAPPADSESEGSADGATDPGGKNLVRLPGRAEPLLVDSARRVRALTSKKALLRFRDSNTRLVFDDSGLAARDANEVVREKDESGDEGAERGPLAAEARRRRREKAERERAEFVERERASVERGDVVDREVARRKRREKREKRRERERKEAQGEVAGAAGAEVVGAGDAYADFVADAQLSGGDESGGEDGDCDGAGWADRDGGDVGGGRKERKRLQTSPSPESASNALDAEGRPAKKAKTARREGKKGGKGRSVSEPETLEDLEALAAGLLG